MVINTLALLAGICSFQLFPHLPAVSWGWLAAIVALGCWFVPMLRPLSVFLFALLWAWWHAGLTLSDRLPETYAGKNLLVQGYIETIPEAMSEDSYRFIFIVKQLQTNPAAGWQSLTFKTRLRWYKNAAELRARERWQFYVRLKPPRGLANPGGFDYERWLFSQQFAATGYVRKSTDNQRLAAAPCRHINCWRQFLSEQLKASSPPDVSGLLAALAIGDKSAISQQQWETLRNTGTAHLMAISGLHIGLISGLLFVATGRLWRLLRLTRYVPATRAAAAAAILGAFGYAILGGFTLPTQRSFVMVTVFMSGYFFKRSVQLWQALCLSLVLLLLYDPLAVLSPGFWLSFGAVAWIFYVMTARHGSTGKLKNALRIQVALSLGLLPVLLLGFQQTSFTAPLANLLAVPIVGLGVVPLLLVGTALLPLWPDVGGFLVAIAGNIMQLLSNFLHGLDALPMAVWSQDAGGLIAAVLCLLASLFILAPAGLAVRLAGLLLLGPLLLSRPPRPEAGTLWLDVLDVGQGLSAVVRTRQHTLVYDTGPRSPSGFDAGKSVVAPFLVSESVHKIDKLVISHSDNDHRGGAKSLFELIRTDAILSGMPEKIEFARSRSCRRGQGWNWDGVIFKILSPVTRTRGNNASCVLRVTAANGQAVLLTGDIESTVEQQLVQDYGRALRAQVLVVPHHGSRTSSTAPFVAAVGANTALIPAGYANRFGFPKADIVERYQQSGAEIHVTGREGAIRVVVGRTDEVLAITLFRHANRHYWQQPAGD